MTNTLDHIIQNKIHEVSALKQDHRLTRILENGSAVNRAQQFKSSLTKPTLAVIAEIKRHSPSKGKIAEILDPVALAKQYINANCSAISVLTDNQFFSGSLSDLEKIAAASPQTPILRKDFIIDEIQIAESVASNAAAILLIASVLDNKTRGFLRLSQDLGLAAIVEIHNERELEIALASDAKIIGINNRDLKTMTINRDTAFALIEKIPSTIIKVAESGIESPHQARDYYQAGFDAVLIGTALVTSDNPQQFILECTNEN